MISLGPILNASLSRFVLQQVHLPVTQLQTEHNVRRLLTSFFCGLGLKKKTSFPIVFPSLPPQGSRFEVSAVGSLCLSKLVYYTASAFHSKHILRHLSDSHRLHINTRDAVCSIQELENMEGRGYQRNTFQIPCTLINTIFFSSFFNNHNLKVSFSSVCWQQVSSTTRPTSVTQ